MPKRTLIISDVHGMYDELLRVLDAVSCASDDQLIFVGDYIDRGPRSREVIDLMLKLREDPHNIFLRGNHEEMVLRLLDGETGFWYTWLEYGEGKPCLRSYGIDPGRIHPHGDHFALHGDDGVITLDDSEETTRFMSTLFPVNHIQFMRETTVRFETEDFFVSHGGIETGLSLHEQGMYTDSFLIWGDEEFLTDDQDYGKVIIYGHYHWLEPRIGHHKVGIALQDAVAVFDLLNMTITDSRGRTSSECSLEQRLQCAER